MPGFLRQSTASQSRAIGPFVDDTDFKTPETGLTINASDVKLVVNGGTSANKNSGGGTHRVNGVYSFTFDATDTATVGEMEVSISVSGALIVFDKFVVLEEAVYDMLFAASAPGYIANAPVNVAQFGGSNGTFSSGRPEVNTTHAAGTAWGSGAITAASIASNAIADTKIATGAITAAKFAAGAIDAAAIADGAIDAGAIASSAITDTKIASGAFTSAKFASGAFDAVWSVTTRELTAFSSSFKTGYALSSAGIQAIWDALTSVLTTVGSIGKLLVDNINATISSRASQTSVDTIDANVDQALLDIADVQTAVDNVQTSIDDGVSIGVGGITTTSFAAGAIDSAALAQSAGQEIADEVLDRNIAGGGSGNTRNVRNALRALRNRVDGSTGTLTVYQEDDSTSAWTATLSRSAVDPITEVNPT